MPTHNTALPQRNTKVTHCFRNLTVLYLIDKWWVSIRILLSKHRSVVTLEEAAGFSTDCFSQRLRLPDTSPGLKSCIFNVREQKAK